MLTLDVAGATNIGPGSSINLTGKGFAGGLSGSNTDSRGLSFNGFTAIGSGGSHGGHGSFATRGVTYGDFRAPLLPGAGGSASGANVGGNGGGALRLVTDSLVLDGAVLVDGANGGSGATSGAGGSAYITVNGSISGGGFISARGGSAAPFGGGGRIALVYDTNTTFNLMSLNAAPHGDTAGAGTAFLKSSAQTLGELRINRGVTSPGTGQPTLIPLENGGTLNLDIFRLIGGARASTTNQIIAPIYEIDSHSELVP